MKRKWWVALIVLLVVILLSLFWFRDALLVRLFPRAVLSKSITCSIQQLEQRFERSPVHLLTSALDSDGCQDISMKLDTDTELMGAAHYTMELRTQSGPNRILGTGSVSTGAGMLDFHLYLDAEFAAVSSQALTEGNYYGLTYDTFSQDIRRFELISLLIGEETMNGWEAALEDIQSAMERSYVIPELSPEDIRTALMGALTLKPIVDSGEGKGQYTVSFSASGAELAEAAQPYLNQIPEQLDSLILAMGEDMDSSLNVVFSLREKLLTKILVGITCASESWQITVELGQDPMGGPISLELVSCQNEVLDRIELTMDTASDMERYQEQISLKQTRNGVQNQLSADYTWDLSSGDMVLDLVRDGKEYPIRLNLTGEEGCFTVTTQEFGQILSAFTGREKTQTSICTLTVSPGEPLEAAPDYRNLSDWSFEDLMLLLSRLGNLIGFKLG